jgi:hypothetical protein
LKKEKYLEIKKKINCDKKKPAWIGTKTDVKTNGTE